VPVLGDLPGEAHLAAEAMPVDALGAELAQDLEGAPLAFSGMDDHRLAGIDRDLDEGAKRFSWRCHRASGTQ
jgi:hypothetical protein